MSKHVTALFGQLQAKHSVGAMVASFDAVSGTCPCRLDEGAYNQLKIAIKAGEDHDAAAMALALATCNGDALVRRLRRDGAMRISRLGFHARGPSAVASVLLAVAPAIGLDPQHQRYLHSVQALHMFAASLREGETWLIAELTARRHVVLKTLLAIIDRLFWGQWPGGERTLRGDDPMHYSLEDLTEALSSIIVLFKSRIGDDPGSWAMADAEGLLDPDNNYLDLLVAMARINRFREAETLVDVLPYEAVTDNDCVRVRSVDPGLERSVRLGYSLHEGQRLLRVEYAFEQKARGEAPPPIREFAEHLYRAGMSEQVVLRESPVARLVVNFPWIPELVTGLGDRRLYFEEVLNLYQLNVDVHDGSVDAVLDVELATGVTGMDVFRAQRLFAFIAHQLNLALGEFEEQDTRTKLAAQSVVCVMKRDLLVKFLTPVLPGGNADAVIELLTLRDDGRHVDLQYSPFIKAGDHYVFSMAILARSNLLRNLVVYHDLTRQKGNKSDPMIEAVVDALREAGCLVEADKKIPHSGGLDADVIAFKDGVLFLFECKNAFHPCYVHEQRTSHDHIERAAEQLDDRIPFLAQPKVQRDLFRNLGWPALEVTSVRTGIITANRVFHGMQSGAHPVRQAHELTALVRTGRSTGPDYELCLWEGDHFAATDLMAYLDGELLIADHFAAMEPAAEVYPFGAMSLVFDTWTFNQELHTARMVQRYPKAESSPGE